MGGAIAMFILITIRLFREALLWELSKKGLTKKN
jgi:hypothetical protein